MPPEPFGSSQTPKCSGIGAKRLSIRPAFMTLLSRKATAQSPSARQISCVLSRLLDTRIGIPPWETMKSKHISTSLEHCLAPYIGPHNIFAQIREHLDLIECILRKASTSITKVCQNSCDQDGTSPVRHYHPPSRTKPPCSSETAETAIQVAPIGTMGCKLQEGEDSVKDPRKSQKVKRKFCCLSGETPRRV